MDLKTKHPSISSGLSLYCALCKASFATICLFEKGLREKFGWLTILLEAENCCGRFLKRNFS